MEDQIKNGQENGGTVANADISKPVKVCEVKLIMEKFELDYPELAAHLKFQSSGNVSFNPVAGVTMNEAEDFWYQSQGGGTIQNPTVNEKEVMPDSSQNELTQDPDQSEISELAQKPEPELPDEPKHPQLLQELGQGELPQEPDQVGFPEGPEPMFFNMDETWSDSDDDSEYDEFDQYESESESDFGYESASSDFDEDDEPEIFFCPKCLQLLV